MTKEQQKITRNLRRLKNKDKINEQQRLYRKNNPEKFKKYYLKNVENYRKKARDYNLEHKDKIKIRRKNYMNTPNGRLTSIKGSAKVRGIIYNLPKEYAIKLLSSECHYCGLSDTQVGIDRLDSNIGYEIDNCVSCCTKCNYMKGVYTYKDFITQCTIIAQKHI